MPEAVYVLVKAMPGRIEETVKAIQTKQGVLEASAVTGAYDIIVKVGGGSVTEALAVVVKEIRSIPGVQSTETLVTVRM